MKYFVNFPYTAETLKNEYRELCKKLHPDRGGNESEFKAMSAEYEQAARNLNGTRQHAQQEAAAEARRREREEEEAEARREREAARKAQEEEERREAERIAKAQEESRAAVRSWAKILERIPADIIGKKRYWSFDDKKAAAAYVATTKRNIQAVVNHYFPGLKVKVTITGQIYKENFSISWEDGPTEKEVQAIPEIKYFISSYYECDPYADYGNYRDCKETAPWREAYGGTLGDCTHCDFCRTLSEEGREQAARIAAEYFQGYDPAKMQHRNEEFTATWQEWAKFADTFNIDGVIRHWEMLVRCYGQINGDSTGTIYYSNFTEYLKEYVKVDVIKKEKAPEFTPKYGKTLKAIKKALSGNDFCTMQYNEKKAEKEWCPVDIFAALLDNLEGVHICKPYNYSDEKHWSRLYSSSYTIARKRREKFAALGIELENTEKVKSITAELRAALIREREEIENQRREWEAEQANEQANQKTANSEKRNTTKKSAQSKPTATTCATAPAEGLQLIETPEGVAVIGKDWKDTYFNKKEIRSHGATWNKERKQWEATNPDDIAKLRAWFGMRDGFGDIHEKTDEEIKAEAAEEIRQEAETLQDSAEITEESTAATGETGNNCATISPLLAEVANMLQAFFDIMEEAKKWEGVTIPAATIERWKQETTNGTKAAAARLCEVCACLGSLTPKSRKDFDALGVIFWTLSEQLKSGADPSTIGTATDYARTQLWELIERTQTANQARAVRESNEPTDESTEDHTRKAA